MGKTVPAVLRATPLQTLRTREPREQVQVIAVRRQEKQTARQRRRCHGAPSLQAAVKEQPGYQAGAQRQEENTWGGHRGVSCSPLIMNLLHYLEAVSCSARSGSRSDSELA